jgi:prepilin-type N-terminal cleavage/methylation domain-containing protein/prepilin-type processing-associated H-X9-DG protein
MERRTHSRTGFTAIELMVALMVIGLLLGLLLPAVQQSRMMSKQIECSHRLKQIGIAAHEYMSVHGFLPDNNHPFLMQLFPHLGLENWLHVPFERHLGQRHAAILCPLDVLHSPRESGSYSYVVTGGGRLGLGEGLFRVGRADQPGIAWKDISDGLSTTGMMSERRAKLDDHPYLPRSEFERGCAADPVRCAWRLDRASFPLGDDEAFVQACGDATRRTNSVPLYDYRRYFVLGPGKHYFHSLPPNSPTCVRGYPYETSQPLTATSHHAGGVNLLLCDGAVRFVSNSIDLKTWWALGTRNGNETVGAY